MNAVPREKREKHMHCSRCDALCCRLTVVVFREDAVPAHLTVRNEHGTVVMARDADGWCVALDGAKMNCGIYATRPAICRKFAMAGPYCLEIRAEARRAADIQTSPRSIPIRLRPHTGDPHAQDDDQGD